MRRINEAHTFFTSFTNTKARKFVQEILKKNYAEAIMVHHPEAHLLEKEDVTDKCQYLVDSVFQRIEEIQASPEELFPLFAQLSRNKQPRDKIWFDEFLQAYQFYKHQRKLNRRYEKIKNYLHGSSYCDIGCGGGDFVAFLKHYHQPFQQVAGIDVMDWRTEAVKEEIGFQMLDFSQPDTFSKVKYDTMSCLAVLHHVGNTDEAQGIFLQNIRKSLSEGGRLIIEEDVILPEDELLRHQEYQEQIQQLKEYQINLSDFLQFDYATQKDCIILIDFLANALAVGVPEMAFPCGFRSIEAWTDILENNGFSISKVKIAGFVPGNFNQSSHVYFVLNKK
ncbi:class I SAM-dependent methyltransferase [Catalinimonas niigatensis]|uniref:class I SAM-dependent methyltransferase n=1 Tax=Catalinimonas niigatensis TaxID=1397264 RepID=UPI0026667E57|nr:methyltransferase domain-containing protein [Catalinimonas niigatensis]WPP48989.1 methyltransferase domain-containing protein [Catalinimonas niigatensis]